MSLADQSHRAGKGRALHPRQSGLGAGVDDMEQMGQGAGIRHVLIVGIVRHAAHPVEIGPGAEGFAIGPQQHRADRRIAGGMMIGGREQGDEPIVEGIVHLRTIEGEGGNAVFMGNDEAHGPVLRR
jgi:hypothetical protein